MQDDRPDQRWLSRFALPVSAGLHVVVVALLIFGLPHSLLKPPEDQAVSVDLVPPPEAPPEPKPKVEPPAAQPEAEKPPEKKAEAPPAAPQQQSPIPRLTPVFQYGDKDAGPKKSPDGNSVEEEAAPADTQQKPEEQTATVPDTPAADAADPGLSLPDASAIPAPRPAKAAREPTATKLKPAKKLFSPSATGNPLAMTAMGGLPRSARGATLCVTELREQLLRTAPPYFADLLPSYPLAEGSVIDVPDAAFRANGVWRNLGYRCEVDANATKVLSFAFQVGEPIPRSQWKQRGFPAR